MNRWKKTAALLLVGGVLVLNICSCSRGESPKLDNGQTEQPVATETATPVPTEGIILVNCWKPIDESYSVDVRELPNGQKVAAECYAELMEMLDDCRGEGLNPEVCSGFRTIAFQQSLYEDKVERVMEEGHVREDAERIAATEVARPGTSEHHTGLAVDLIDKDYPVLDETQEQHPTQQWFMKNSWKYGFVLRYPTGKTDITGIIYEPWHYRYVGVEAAERMHEQDLCLEEYLERYG
ncbi:MAG: M15 family metallopeptidase [Oscillospiraceae bacterium]|nr:M15 family metallopeptidase [Oscillospiraceae bacterium]